MFLQLKDQDATSLNTLPSSSALSETEVMFIGSGEEKSDVVLFAKNRIIQSKIKSQLNSNKPQSKIYRIANFFYQKFNPQTNSKNTFFDKSKCKEKKRHCSFTLLQVLLLGFILLSAGLTCIIIKKEWFNNNENFSSSVSSNKRNFKQHSYEDQIYHKKLVQDINSNPKAKWKAKYNKFASKATNMMSLEKNTLQTMFSENIKVQKWSKSQIYLTSLKNLTLLKRFDSRLQWPQCNSVHRVYNQGGCGSCWAIAATSVMSDRICLHSNGSKQPIISAQDLIECCKHCGGCRGTIWALFSFVYWKEEGIVTGSDYESYDGCKPYKKSPSCGSPCSVEFFKDKTSCYLVCQTLYDTPYHLDLHKAKSVYWVKPNALNNLMFKNLTLKISNLLKLYQVDYETIIKRELMLYGPMIACFVIFDEFQHYKSGIYQSMTSNNTKELYGHCAKLIGWGEELNGDKFWIYMNTWGASWGEGGLFYCKNSKILICLGFFRVAINELPEEAAAGIPLL